MFSKDTSIVLTIHNQEPIIDKVIRGIINNMSVNAKQMVIVFDGCKDNTESIVRRELKECRIKPDFYHLPNVWETKANNFAFRKSTCPYIVTVQDDAEIQDLNFDQRLLKPFDVVENLLGVTGRNAQDETLKDGQLRCYNVAGKDVNSPRNLFAIRDVVVRTPIAFDNSKLEAMNYLDEEFAPLDGDDKDLSFRAYKKYGWVVGSYIINYNSPLNWGKTRNNHESNRVWALSATKNVVLLIERHKDAMLGKKHSQDIIIE